MMTYTLANETIRPTNDGSVAISYVNDEDKSVSWLQGKFPVLSVEVSLCLV